MGRPWKHLRGEELSAYAASIHAADQWGDFAKHLATHGSVEDFHRFVELDCKPVEKCLEVFSSNPLAALDWIKKHLNAPQSDPHQTSQTHAFVGKFVCEHMADFGDPATATAIFEHINFNAMTKFHKIDLFKPLVSSGMHHIVEKNWETYKPLMEGLMEKNLANYVTFSAFFGFNLHDRINWRPSYYKDKEDLFVSCCVGGLVDELKNISLSEKKHAVIIDAFCKTVNPMHRERSENFERVLNHLWDSFPNTSWYSDNNVLQAILHTSPDLTQKIVQYFQKSVPHVFHCYVNSIALKAIVYKNKSLVKTLIPLVAQSDLAEVVDCIIRRRQKYAVEAILSLPNGDRICQERFNTYKDESRLWAEQAYNTLQASRLKKTLKMKGSPAPKRKM